MKTIRRPALRASVVSVGRGAGKTGLCGSPVSKRLAKREIRKPVRPGTSLFSARLRGFSLAGEQGFEPQLPDPEFASTYSRKSADVRKSP
jgi:hypothetical protein